MHRFSCSGALILTLILFSCGGDSKIETPPGLSDPEAPAAPPCAAYDGNKGADKSACGDVAKYNGRKGCDGACTADGGWAAQATYDAANDTCSIICDKSPAVECPTGASPAGTLYLFPKANGPSDYAPLQCAAQGFETIVCLATNQLSSASGTPTCLDLSESSGGTPTTQQWEGCKAAFPGNTVELGMIINQGATCINPYVDDPAKYIGDLQASASAKQIDLSWLAIDKEKGGSGSNCTDDGTASSCKEELIQAMQATGAKLAYAKNPNNGTCPASDTSACAGHPWVGLNEEYTSNSDIDDCWQKEFEPNDPGSDTFVSCLTATQSYNAPGTAPLLCLASPKSIPQGECEVDGTREYFEAATMTWEILDKLRGADGNVGFYIPTPSLD